MAAFWHDGVVSLRRVLAAVSLTALLLQTGTVSGVAATDPSPEHTALEQEADSGLLVLVTKSTPIAPLDYAPQDLVTWPRTEFQVRAEVHDQLEAMFAAAQEDGQEFRLVSGYRSYDTQAGTYDYWLRHYGRKAADATSARPGHSEHQTGLAVDLDSRTGECYLDACFGDTSEGRWVAKHGHEFGFLISYPEGARQETGYAYEPWHIRYVGPRVASTMHDHGIALLQDYVSVPGSSVRIGQLLGSLG